MTARDAGVRPLMLLDVTGGHAGPSPRAPATVRPLGAVLPSHATPPPISPWSPRTEAPPVAPPAAGPSEAELSAVFEQAREHGRADGRAETAELRAQLTALVDELAAARAAVAAPAAELITEIASCVIEAWTLSEDRGAMLAPIVRGWSQKAPGQPATARVHPGDVTALAAAVGDLPLAIVGDPALAPGAIEITSPTLELCHDWRTRLSELRTAITGAIAGADEGADESADEGAQP
jgi:hypothetical protein